MNIHTRKYIAGAMLLGFLISLAIPSLGLVGATGVGSCTISPKPGRILVQFDEKLLVANRGAADAQTHPVNVSIPKGDYKVTLVSFDDHSAKPNQEQPHESWFAELRDGSGNRVVASNAIRDLPSNIDTLTEVVNARLTVSEDVASVVAIHAAFPSDNPNSIRAVCAAFDRLDAEQNGDGDEHNNDDTGGVDGIIENINRNINTVNINVQNFFGNGDGNGGNDGDGGTDNNADAPDIRSVDVDDIRSDRAALVCEVDANGADTDVWFEWSNRRSEVEDGDGERTRTVVVDKDETRKDVQITIRNLDEDTRYFVRCFAENDEGDDRSNIVSFRTGREVVRGDQPEVTTLAATNVTQTSARLNGEVDPNGEDTDAWFEWGTSRSALNRATRAENVGSGTRVEDFDSVLSGLTPGVTYYFRAVAENQRGIDRGSIQSFTTAPPTVIPTVTQVVTRVVEVVRNEENEANALIVTLEASRTGRRGIDYTVSYDNQTGDTFRDAQLVAFLPSELAFVSARPREDSERRGELTFDIGTIRPGDKGSFLIETEAESGVDEGENIVFTATVTYTDAGKEKAVTVVNESTLGQIRRGSFTASLFEGARDFFTNPFFWFLVLLLIIFLVYRYFAFLSRPAEGQVVIRETQPAQPQLPNQG